MSEGVTPSPKGTGWGFQVNSHNLLGGLVLAVVALAMLAFGFYLPNTVVPRLMAGVVTLIGIGVAIGWVPVHGPRDFYGGMALVLLSILALTASAELPGQRGFAFGPGTAPRLFSIALAAMGAAVALGGVFVEGPPIEKYKIRGPALVILSILSFAVMIRGFNVTIFGIPLYMPALGLIPSTFFAFIISIFGSTEMRWVESLIAAAAMTAFCVLLFVYLLNLPFQLWPRFY